MRVLGPGRNSRPGSQIHNVADTIDRFFVNPIRPSNLIIAGTVKSGTTSLFRYLSRHSAIYGSNIKETCFFLPLRYGEKRRPISEYESYFTDCSQEKYVLESTPGYFDGGKTVAQEIKRELHGARVILILRNPVDRLVSFFSYQKAQLQLPPELTLRDYIANCVAIEPAERMLQANDPYWGIDGGRYIHSLPGWFEVFSTDEIRILFFEDLEHGPMDVLEGLGDWLQIDNSEFRKMSLSVENKTVHFKSAWLQRLAISANRKMESALSRAPFLKRFIRSLYYFVNAGRTADDPNDTDLRSAEHLYQSDNERLAVFLRRHGYSDLPLWLRESEL